MKLPGIFPKSFGSRLFIMTLIAGLIPIAIFSILIETYGTKFQDEVEQAIQEGYEDGWARSSTLLTRISETSIRQKAYDIAAQLDLTLQSHSYMTLNDLRRDKKFRNLAVQRIGKTGYTGLQETKTGVIRFHKERSLENTGIEKYEQSLPAYWEIIKTNRSGKPAGGYFDWIEENGTVSKKYMYIVPLSQSTSDGVRLSVFVTAHLDEFTSPTREAKAIQKRTATNLTGTAGSLFGSFRDRGFIFMGMGILLVSFIALAIGMYFSRGISRLSDATKKINDGDFNVSVKPVLSGEIRKLMEDFNSMVGRLKETTVSKELLQESEKRLVEANGDLRNEIAIRSLAEKALATEKERLAVTLRSIGDGVITIDTNGRVILINKAAEQLTGFPQEEARGKPLGDIFTMKDQETAAGNDPVRTILETGQALSLSISGTLVSRYGTEHFISRSASPIRSEDATLIGVVIVFRDITEQRRMEDELLKIRKLESIGTLAGGIAHDFNNLLAVILGNISFAKMLLNADEKAMKRLDEAERATVRGKDLSYKLLTFARGGTPVKKLTVLDELIYDAVDITLAGSTTRCVFEIPDDLYKAEVDEGQVRQVIHNLVMNAREAMPEGGNITIRAENIDLARPNGIPLPPGNYICISVEDTGTGIDEKSLERIFDPYFTTKEMGSEKGMGLGLAICYSIVKNHHGYITVKSKKGIGTTVYVYLPARVLLEDIEPNQAPVYTKKRKKILYMDDEEQVRDMAGQILKHIGYEVEFARDGAEAIALFKKEFSSGGAFDLVILDLTVPGGMGGREAMQNLLAINPNIKAVVSSGYVNDPIVDDYKRFGFSGVVAKPYSLEQLRKVIDMVLSNPPG